MEFTFDVSPAGDKITIKYSGTLEGDGAMKGTIDFGGQAKGTFSAKKQ